jgi:hypothetical protein
MPKFLIYLSIYFCLTCFGLSFNPSLEAGVQLRQWFKTPGYGVRVRALTPYLGGTFNRRLCGLQNKSERSDEEKVFRHLSELNTDSTILQPVTWSLSQPADSVTVKVSCKVLEPFT